MSREIQLRPVLESDLDSFFAHQQDSEAVQMAAFTRKDPSDREAFDAHWAKIISNPEITTRTILFNDSVSGHIAQFVMDEKPEITYWIGREFWGKGIATEALRLFLQEISDRPLYARAAFDNHGSLKVLEKCGFVKTGTDKFYANARGKEIEEVVFRLG